MPFPGLTEEIERLAASANVTLAQATACATPPDIERLSYDEEVMQISERVRERYRGTLDRLRDA